MAKIHIIEQYLKFLINNDRASSTIRSYASDLYLFAKWFENKNHEEIKPHKITPTDLRFYKQYLVEENMKPNSINRKLGVLKSFINYLIETDRIKQRFPLPKLVVNTLTTPRWLDKNQQNAMLRHLEKYSNERDYITIKLLLNTGLRVSELVNLKWTDVRMTDKKGAITVRYSKANRYRDIPLNKDARNVLLKLGFIKMCNQDLSVLQGQRGRLTPRGVQLMIKRRFEYTDLDFMSPHILRHTFCKNLVNAGVSLEKIALLAGHESLDSTKLYCQPSFDDLSESVDKISEEE